jgi:hypothetical protein
MEFYLTYEGPLNATQRDPRDGEPPRHPENLRAKRRHFHAQLREIWNVLPALQKERVGELVLELEGGNPDPFLTKADELAAHHAHYGFNFVPLVTQQLDLLCNLEILMLRPDRPGTTPWAGDIDNRLKTLLDALTIPVAGEGYANEQPKDDEKPLFVLLEDDKLLTKVSVETDRLLQPVSNPPRMDDVRVVIKVSVRPYSLHLWNIHMG